MRVRRETEEREGGRERGRASGRHRGREEKERREREKRMRYKSKRRERENESELLQEFGGKEFSERMCWSLQRAGGEERERERENVCVCERERRIDGLAGEAGRWTESEGRKGPS